MRTLQCGWVRLVVSALVVIGCSSDATKEKPSAADGGKDETKNPSHITGDASPGSGDVPADSGAPTNTTSGAGGSAGSSGGHTAAGNPGTSGSANHGSGGTSNAGGTSAGTTGGATGTNPGSDACTGLPKLAACSGLAPIDVDSICAALADAECHRFRDCDLIAANAVDACVTSETASCNAGKAKDSSLSSGREHYDGVAAACCVKFFSDSACNMLLQEADSACGHVFQGQQGVGAACYLNKDCNEGAYCDTTAGCPGKCKAFVPIGGTCGTGLSCGKDATCVSGSCKALGCLGAPCGQSVQAYCVDALECVGNGQTTCKAAPTLGEPCDATTIGCDGASACSLASVTGQGKCAARSGSDAACWFNFNCKGDYYCSGADTTAGTQGTCKPVLAPGADCTPSASSQNDPCGNFLFKCEPGTMKCETTPEVGDPCAPTKDHCEDSWCDPSTKKCSAQKEAQELCTTSRECVSSNCVGGMCVAAPGTCIPPK